MSRHKWQVFCGVTFRLNANIIKELPIPGRKVEDMQGHHRWGYNVGAYNDFRKNSYRTQSTFSTRLHGCNVIWFEDWYLVDEFRFGNKVHPWLHRIVPWWKRKVTCAKWNVKSRLTLSVKYPTSRLRFESSVVSASVKALSYSVIRCGTWNGRFTWRQMADRILRTIIAPLFGIRTPVFSHALIHLFLLPPAWPSFPSSILRFRHPLFCTHASCTRLH